MENIFEEISGFISEICLSDLVRFLNIKNNIEKQRYSRWLLRALMPHTLQFVMILWLFPNKVHKRKGKYFNVGPLRCHSADPNLVLSINGDKLENVNKYCYLGITLDSQLTLKPHIERTVASCNHLLFSLSRIRRFITCPIAIQVYKSLIMSRLSYGVLLCQGANKVTTTRLQKVQNRALRICHCADRYTSNLKLHEKSNVLPLSLRMRLDTYKNMYRRLLLQSRGTETHLRLNTRSNDALLMSIDKPNTERFVRSVTYQGPKLWNELPPNIRNINDCSKFECEVKKLIKAEFEVMTSL